MSVYYEALKSGRIRHEDVVRVGARRALREAKQYEADERNARTPYERTAAYRRELAKRSQGKAAKA